MNEENEIIWKDIPGYEGLYKVSNTGKIFSCVTNRELSVIQKKDGYTCISLCDKDHNKKQYRIHQLVAKAFIPNPNNLPMINHKNEIKNDNRVENLEWCNNFYNSNYGNRNLIISQKMKGVSKSKEAIEKRKITLKEKLSNMTKEERQAIYSRTISEEQKKIISNTHKKENLSKETIEAMSIANILNRQYAYSKDLLNFKTQNDNSGIVYEEGFTKVSDSDFIVLN
jgi:hypothetical protein